MKTIYELDSCGNRQLVIPRGWEPRCRLQDPRKRKTRQEVMRTFVRVWEQAKTRISEVAK